MSQSEHPLGLTPLMEEECEPTVESQLTPVVEAPVQANVVSLTAVINHPRQSVIDALEMTLERARSGELQGVVILQNLGAAVSHLCGGFYSYTDMLAAAEDWKFIEQVKRNLVCPQCGHDERDKH